MKIEHITAFGLAGQPVTCPSYASMEFPTLHLLGLFLLSRFEHYKFIDSFSVFVDNNRYMNVTRQGYTLVYCHDFNEQDKIFVEYKNNFSI